MERQCGSTVIWRPMEEAGQYSRGELMDLLISSETGKIIAKALER